MPLPQRHFRVFSHIGELYEGRSVVRLLESIARMIEQERLDANTFQIQLVGPVQPSCLPDPAFIEKAESAEWLKIVDHQLPRPEAVHVAQTSDALILVQPHSAIQVPGKLFEYIQIGRPVLALVPPDSSIERLLANSGVSYVCAYTGASQPAFEEALLKFFALDSEPKPPSAWFKQTFDSESRAALLAGIIDQAQHREQTPNQF
ncbi:MAG: hypothetical protein JOZ62_14775 [Acidobacteriaceae bacterium]|nr:hypothetical protein [Acidobacteriaceae bacterium]